jgi:hypothetical protein
MGAFGRRLATARAARVHGHAEAQRPLCAEASDATITVIIEASERGA